MTLNSLDDKMNYRIRKKGETKKGIKYVLERRATGESKWESRTLNPSEQLWNKVCPDMKRKSVSDSPKEQEEKVHEKCVYSLLTEPEKRDTIQLTDAQKKALAWELSK